MMLPLCTMVTRLRPFASAYSMAARMRRLVPSSLMGLMPKPEVAGNRTLSTPNSALRNAYSFLASSEPAANSMPA